MNLTPETWDHVIIGAGSAGAVVASRYADAGERVLLLEAGEDQPDTASGKDRPDASAATHPLRDASKLVLTGHNWDYRANLRTTNRLDDLVRSGRPARADGGPARALWARFPYPLGKVVGGSSAVNGAVALRGLPRDFDEWVKLGNPDWSWEHVLPYYKRLEDDRDFADDQHGQGGPVAVTRPGPDQIHGLDLAFWQECRRRGLPDLPDLNRGLEAGVGPVPTNSVHGERMDTATTYLTAARRCGNLDVRAGMRATRVLMEGRRAVGVEVLCDGRLRSVYARNVILCAGAIGTPVILLRSGIGSATLCSALGITPVADLPGVGENLADHVSVVVWALPKPGVCRPSTRWRDVMARVSSGFDGDVDLQVGLLNNVNSAAIPGFAGRMDGALVVGISVMLMRPESRGRVFVDDADPHSPPVIELALGSAAEDVERLVHGVRLAWSFLRSPDIAGQLERIQFWSDRMVGDDHVLRSGVRNIMNPGWHAAGSARMGPAHDRMSVVDQQCRVHGVENLQVVDASVFPAMPSSPTNLTTIMLAERVASGGKG